MAATTNETKGSGARLGRPRDGTIRRKAIQAALECYQELGWGGFNFETVSIRAKVGRPALYRRWSNREELLIDAFRELTPTVEVPEHDNVYDDLIAIALEYRRIMLGVRGLAGMRLFFDKEAAPEVFKEVFAEISANRDVFIRQVLIRAQERGEVRSDADLQTAIELLIGALMLDAINDTGAPNIPSTVEKTVTTLLRGLRPHPSS